MEKTMARSCLAIILAAGESTRMKASHSKVLFPVGNLPMISHVISAAKAAGVGSVALVVGRDSDAVEAASRDVTDDLSVWEQKERLGTAHAALSAAQAIEEGYDDVLVIFGDTPLVRSETLMQSREMLAEGADVAVIGFRTDKPHGYGRLIEENGELVAIKEERDATDEERKIGFCNGGLMAINGHKALEMLREIGNENAKSEYYLTDIVGIAREKGGRAVAVEASNRELIGINNRAELAEVEQLWQWDRRVDMMKSGVTMVAPETVFLSHDTVIEADVTIEPNVIIGTGVTIRSGAVIKGFSHLEGTTIGSGCTVGPFARLRPGADLQSGSKVGNFCEVKNATVGEGAKVNHLTYIGDASIGASSNIGAGTITCNYDGVNKHFTQIGAEVFVGSNSSLVAPVAIGDHSYIASGSVITRDVPSQALAFGRARQENKEGVAEKIRARNHALKAASGKPKK